MDIVLRPRKVMCTSLLLTRPISQAIGIRLAALLREDTAYRTFPLGYPKAARLMVLSDNSRLMTLQIDLDRARTKRSIGRVEFFTRMESTTASTR
jgi:hypothetical protein